MVIVGLGNPGLKYAKTRHNTGFMFVDEVAKAQNVTFRLSKKHHCLIAETKQAQQLTLIKPITYMNNSGLALKSIFDYYRLTPEEILVVYDDLNLPLAALRIRKGGSDGGHKGMRSILEWLQTEQIPRLRIGIGATDADAVDFVLGKFRQSEIKQIRDVLALGPTLVDDLLTKGLDYIMNRYNG